MALEVHTQLLITENKYYNEFRIQVRFDFDQDRQYFKSFFLLYVYPTHGNRRYNEWLNDL